ncbi:MAG: hypothetical protein WBV43_19145 [Pseudolabrys sp.]
MPIEIPALEKNPPDIAAWQYFLPFNRPLLVIAGAAIGRAPPTENACQLGVSHAAALEITVVPVISAFLALCCVP